MRRLASLDGVPCGPVFAGYLKHVLLDADLSITVALAMKYLNQAQRGGGWKRPTFSSITVKLVESPEAGLI
jgi:hypothetical protein